MAEQLADVFDVQIQFPLDLRTVKADLNARDAIGTFQRYEGLEVYVVSEVKKYRLEGGITNDDWVEIVSGNGGVQSVTVGTGTPTGGSNGDIYFRNVSGGTDVWYNNDGTWGVVGTIPTGGGAIIQNGTITPDSTVSELNTIAGTSAPVGTLIYRDLGVEGTLIFTKLATDYWTYRTDFKATT